MDKRRKRSFARSPTGITFSSEADLKEYEENRNSLKGKFQDFCSDTSFTPVAHVYKAGSAWKKFVWVCVSLGLTAYMSYQCSSLIINYLKYPSEVDMVLAFAPEMDFPSVTVCNLNPIKYSKIMESKYAKAFEDLEDDGSDDLLYQSFVGQYMMFDDSMESSEEYFTHEYFPFETGTPGYPWDSGSEEDPPGTPPGTPPGPPPATEPGPPPATEAATEPESGEEGTAANPPVTTETTPTSTPAGGSTSRTATAKPTGNPTGPPPPQGKRRRRAVLGSNAPNVTALMSNMTYNQWDQLEDGVGDSFYKSKSSQHKAIEMISDIVATMDTTTVKKMGHRKKDFIMSCKWQGFPCSPKNFTAFVNYKYGNCFTINSDVNVSDPTPSLRTSNPGPLYGLELELFIEQGEYMPSVSQQAGARVVIHSRGKTPFPEDEGFSISPGFQTSVGMRKTSITRLKMPHGNCTTTFTGLNSLYSELNTVYSKQACMKSCFQEAIIDRCKCGLASYPLPANVSLCPPEKGNCTNEVNHLYTQNLLGCDENCPLPCDDEAFTLTISNAVWPAIRYQRDLHSRMMKSSTKLMRSAEMGGSMYDVAKLEIFYQELNYQLIEQKPSYEFENVLSDLGGQLGLWLGVSILALGEILDFFVSVAHFVFFKATKAAKTGRGSTPIYPYRPPKE